MRIKAIIIGAAMMSSAHAGAFDLASVGNLYLVGDAVATGWDRSQAPRLQQIAPGVYCWNGDLGVGEFKFLISRDSWDSVVGDTFDRYVTLYSPMPVETNDEGSDHDAKWRIATPGNYTLTVDIGGATLTVSSFDIGAASAEYGSTPFGDGCHKCCEVVDGGVFIVKAYSASGEERYLHVGSDGGFVYVDDPKFATVYPADAHEYVQVIVDTGSESLERRTYAGWTSLYIVGGFNGWAFNDRFDVSADDPCVFVWTGDICPSGGVGSAEVKFKGNDSYTPGVDPWGVHPTVDREPFLEACDIITGGIDDFKWEVTRSGRYDVRVNPFKLTASVRLVTAGVPGDVDGDGVVAIADISALIDLILSGTYDERGDIDGNGNIEVADISAVVDLMIN